MSKLRLRGIEKRYGDVAAVAGLDLELAQGEFVSLLGPSGCGKTTTLRMIAGFIDPTAGTIEMDGQVLSSASGALPPEKRGMSMIFQSYAVWPNMTVEQNVAFGLELRKLPRDETRRRVAEMLDVVQMGHLAKRYPAELSGGQQQRVALARAIVIKPSVLLLDEPLSNLDANLREEMRFEIRRLHDERAARALQQAEDALRRGLHRPYQFSRRRRQRSGCELWGLHGAARRARRGAGERTGDVLGAPAEHAALAHGFGRRGATGRRDHRRAGLFGRVLGLCGRTSRQRDTAARHRLAARHLSGRRKGLSHIRSKADDADRMSGTGRQGEQQ
jgi:ABC-type nitrate/sulfonate/bicarbonate transport system ATPase subunit